MSSCRRGHPRRRFTRHYAPWRRNYVLVLAGVFSGAIFLSDAFIGKLPAMPAVPLGLLLLAVAVYEWLQYTRRSFGKWTEGRALDALRPVASRQGLRVQINVSCPTGGDIDAVVITGTQRFAVEVKSWSGLRLSGDDLAKMNGRIPYGDPISQTRREAESIGALPVLWMPRARHSVFVYKGVLVVNGNARTLVNALTGHT